MQHTIFLRITGRVQGVGFRYATCLRARELGLRGWVRNRHDGSVELLAAGNRAACEELALWAQHGPPAAKVTEVASLEVTPEMLATLSRQFVQEMT